MNVEAIKTCIEALNNLDPRSADAYAKAVAYFREAKRVPFFVLDFPNLPFYIFRTRTHQSNNFFEHFADLALPPAGVVGGYGRCNIPGQPVFYGSDFRPTSYMELLEYWVSEKKEQYLFATIGKWKISNQLSALIVTSPYEKDRSSFYDKSHGERLDHFINSYSGEEKEAMILFYKFLFDRFRKPAKNDPQTYLITSAYSNLAFKNKKVDAIFYPSVPFQGDGVNLAIQAGYDFDKNLQLELVARNQFERLDTTPHPTFQEVELRQAKQLDHGNQRIIW
ncbi:MAG: RES domain-containing protein [Sphingobacteriales bacterium]|nr:RES domain-containing protein [Sphingobacteriales bacterium]OJW00215.1 MAG: hypothetical protein BGO52_03775 [Sphingobacteriales bacterium 44-61]